MFHDNITSEEEDHVTINNNGEEREIVEPMNTMIDGGLPATDII